MAAAAEKPIVINSIILNTKNQSYQGDISKITVLENTVFQSFIDSNRKDFTTNVITDPKKGIKPGTVLDVSGSYSVTILTGSIQITLSNRQPEGEALK